MKWRQPSEEVSKELARIQFTIQLWEMPPSFRTVAVGRKLAEQLGPVKETALFFYKQGPGYLIKSIVTLDISQPLEKEVEAKKLSVEGETVVLFKAKVKYENLPTFCFNCGVIGHQHSSCSYPIASEASFRFGDELRGRGGGMKLNEQTFRPVHSAANRRLPQNVWVNPNLLGSHNSDQLQLGKLANSKPAAPPLLAVAISNVRPPIHDDNVSFFQSSRSRVSLVELPDDPSQESFQKVDASDETAVMVPAFMASSQNLGVQLDVPKIPADLYKSLESNSLQIQPPRGPLTLPKILYPRTSPNSLTRLEAQESRKRKGKDPIVYKRQEVKKLFPRTNRALFIEEPKDQSSKTLNAPLDDSVKPGSG